MDNINISVSESGREDNISIVRVDGVIDTLTATQLEDILERLFKRQQYKVILDLAGVDYISSAGWGIFISRIKEVRENGGDIKLANMVPNVYEIYELLEFDNILGAHENVNSAKTGFGDPTVNPGAKKKDPVSAARTTVEELPSIQSVMAAPVRERAVTDTVKKGDQSAERVILEAISRDPFYTISELKVITEESITDLDIGWWGVFGILKRCGLLMRRSRFRYARRSWREH